MTCVSWIIAAGLLAASALAPLPSNAQGGGDAEACEPSAKNLFSWGGTLVNDGARHPANSAAAKVERTAPNAPKLRPRPTAQACQSARDTQPAKAIERIEPHAGMAFWAETLRCGMQDSRRTTEYRFRTGDCAKLFFMPNSRGYLYVANVDSNGKVDYLYPRPGERTVIDPGEEVSFGVSFTGAPGIERVFVLFSKTRLTSVPTLALGLWKRSPQDPQVARTGQVLLVDEHGLGGASKSLQRTDEEAGVSAPGAARYVVVAESELTATPVMVLNLDLVHTSR